MIEFRAAARTAFQLIVIFVLSRFVDPFIARLMPVGSELLQEATSLVVTAFLFGLAGAFLWGEPKISVDWEDFENRELLYRIDLRIREAEDNGVLLKVVARGYAEKPLARWLLRCVAQQGLKLEVAPKQAPVIFTVDASACADDERPLAITPRGTRGVTLLLEGDPPTEGGVWVWAKGVFTARDFLPGEQWEVDYRLVCSTRTGTFLTKSLGIRTDVDKLTIQSL